jgi:prepilin-type N-terminal cleavage/methylation domain-containing protein
MVLRRRRAGFSVVELVMAVGIFSIGIAAVYGQFRDTRQPSQHRLFLAQAQFQAQKLLAESLACSYDELKAWKPSAAFTQLEDQPRFSARATVDSVAGDAIEVVIEVGWGTSDETGGQFPESQRVTVKGLRFQ